MMEKRKRAKPAPMRRRTTSFLTLLAGGGLFARLYKIQQESLGWTARGSKTRRDKVS
jgi:hypothetical protein